MPRNMRLFTWLLFGGLGSALATTTPPSPYVVHEKRQGPSEEWDKQSRARKDFILPIRIALKQQNLDSAEQYLHEISDPDSPKFGVQY